MTGTAGSALLQQREFRVPHPECGGTVTFHPQVDAVDAGEIMYSTCATCRATLGAELRQGELVVTRGERRVVSIAAGDDAPVSTGTSDFARSKVDLPATAIPVFPSALARLSDERVVEDVSVLWQTATAPEVGVSRRWLLPALALATLVVVLGACGGVLWLSRTADPFPSRIGEDSARLPQVVEGATGSAARR